MPRTITISILVSLTIGACAYIGLLPLLAILLLPGLILGLLIGIWRLQLIQWAFTKHQVRKRFFDQVYRSGGFIEDEVIENHVIGIGQKITLAAGKRVNSIDFCVVNDECIHAFAFFPNIVAISKGMYEDFRNDDEMASVLAHEVGHIVMNSRDGWIKTSLEQSRTNEYMADQLAVEFARKAGYEPSALTKWHWRIMGYRYRMGGNIHDHPQSTHPSTVHRIRAVNRLIDSPISTI